MATPVVSGAAALALAAAGGGDRISPEQLKQLLLDSADSILALSGKVLGGVSFQGCCACCAYYSTLLQQRCSYAALHARRLPARHSTLSHRITSHVRPLCRHA